MTYLRLMHHYTLQDVVRETGAPETELSTCSHFYIATLPFRHSPSLLITIGHTGITSFRQFSKHFSPNLGIVVPLAQRCYKSSKSMVELVASSRPKDRRTSPTPGPQPAGPTKPGTAGRTVRVEHDEEPFLTCRRQPGSRGPVPTAVDRTRGKLPLQVAEARVGPAARGLCAALFPILSCSPT